MSSQPLNFFKTYGEVALCDFLEKWKDAMDRMNMSARAYDRILKVARTIADLEGCHDVLTHHIMEAIAYRNLDRPSYMGTSM